MLGNVSNITSLLQNKLHKISYEDGRIEQLQDERRQLLSEIRNLKEKIDTFEAR
jgi:peptidoglycan hydrolase CwlO-like protein